MIYHPDQNKTHSATVKFRQITEAYEVLGNPSKRRLYDKGLFGVGSIYSNEEAKTYSQKVSRSHPYRTRSSPVSGRTPIYNYDKWAKEHYTETFQRKQKDKVKYEKYVFEKNLKGLSKNVENSYYFLGVICLIFICLRYLINEDYDKINPNR